MHRNFGEVGTSGSTEMLADRYTDPRTHSSQCSAPIPGRSNECSLFSGTTLAERCGRHPTWGTMFWTAGQRIDPDSRSSFIWRPDTLSDTVPLMIYTNWQPGEPDYRDQAACMAVYNYHTSYKWYDGRCSAAFCSVCEIDI